MRPNAYPLLAQAAASLSPHGPANVGHEPLYAGVDLGTATIVLMAVDSAGRPVAGRMRPAQVVRDGLVVDFIGAIDELSAMKAELETQLSRPLEEAVGGYPPGVPQPEVRAVAHVLESAGLSCAGLIDEPRAANHVLGISQGAIVDVGGGTTGIAIVRQGEVVHTADEPTGGTHFNLVIAGGMSLEYEAAEALKHNAAEQGRLMALVRPVIEKVATIIGRELEAYPVDEIYLVGGTSSFLGMDAVIEEWLGLPVVCAPEPQLVTPLGIAQAHWAMAASEDEIVPMESAHGTGI